MSFASATSFLLIIENLAVTDLKKPDAIMSITINFPFLDDIKKGVKFKHREGPFESPPEPAAGSCSPCSCSRSPCSSSVSVSVFRPAEIGRF